MVPHAFGTSTSIIAFLVIFLSDDLEPRVATSLSMGQLLIKGHCRLSIPDSRDSMLPVSQD